MARKRAEKGHGSIREVRPGVWRVRVGCGRKADGGLRQRTATVHGTEAAARVRAEEIYADMRANIKTALADDITLADYYNDTVWPAKARTSRANRDGYRVAWAHVPDTWKKRPLSHVPTKTEAQAWVDTMTVGTARAAVKYVRAIYRSAYGDGLLKAEPMAYRLNFTARNQKRTVWTIEDIATAVLASEGTPLEGYILIALGTGARREELLALDWSDIEVDTNGIIWVDISKARTEKDGIGTVKTKASHRRVPIAGTIARRLATMVESGATGAVAATRDGKPLSVGGLVRQWRGLWRPGGHVRKNVVRDDGAMLVADVPQIAINTMRHSHISMCSELGLPVDVNHMFHGHSDDDVETKHYLQLRDTRMLRAAYEIAYQLDRWIAYVEAGREP